MNKKKLICLLIIFLIAQIVFPLFYKVKGTSMLPTFQNNQWVIIDYYGFDDHYKKDDFIIFDLNGESIIKRVIGVAGDHIQIEKNILYINGIEIEENYILEKMETTDLNFVVPDNTVFVLGDNRNASLDSRSYGLINLSNVIGKVIYTFDA